MEQKHYERHNTPRQRRDPQRLNVFHRLSAFGVTLQKERIFVGVIQIFRWGTQANRRRKTVS